MLPPAPTVEAVLIMAALSAHTEGMSLKKCSRFRDSMRSRLKADGHKIRFIRAALPSVEEAQAQAVTLLKVGCELCARRSDCSHPLT